MSGGSGAARGLGLIVDGSDSGRPASLAFTRPLSDDDDSLAVFPVPSAVPITTEKVSPNCYDPPQSRRHSHCCYCTTVLTTHAS